MYVYPQLSLLRNIKITLVIIVADKTGAQAPGLQEFRTVRQTERSSHHSLRATGTGGLWPLQAQRH